MKKRNNLMFIGILVLAVSITIGYAALSQLLTVSGNAAISKATWDVGFSGTPTVTTGSTTTAVPTISADKKTVSFTTSLHKPNDFYEFTVDVKNGGTIPAKISTYSPTTGNADYVGITAKWKDGTYANMNIVTNQTIPANTTWKLVVRLLAKDVNADKLPDADATLKPKISLTFVEG